MLYAIPYIWNHLQNENWAFKRAFVCHHFPQSTNTKVLMIIFNTKWLNPRAIWAKIKGFGPKTSVFFFFFSSVFVASIHSSGEALKLEISFSFGKVTPLKKRELPLHMWTPQLLVCWDWLVIFLRRLTWTHSWLWLKQDLSLQKKTSVESTAPLWNSSTL